VSGLERRKGRLEEIAESQETKDGGSSGSWSWEVWERMRIGQGVDRDGEVGEVRQLLVALTSGRSSGPGIGPGSFGGRQEGWVARMAGLMGWSFGVCLDVELDVRMRAPPVECSPSARNR